MTENWTAAEAVRTFKAHFDSSPCAWRYTPIPGSRIIDVVPVAASADVEGPFEALAYFDEGLKSESFLCTSRGNGTLVKTRTGHWFILQYYLSFPIPNPLAKRMCREIAEHESEAAADALLGDLGGGGGASNGGGKAGKGAGGGTGKGKGKG